MYGEGGKKKKDQAGPSTPSATIPPSLEPFDNQLLQNILNKLNSLEEKLDEFENRTVMVY